MGNAEPSVCAEASIGAENVTWAVGVRGAKACIGAGIQVGVGTVMAGRSIKRALLAALTDLGCHDKKHGFGADDVAVDAAAVATGGRACTVGVLAPRCLAASRVLLIQVLEVAPVLPVLPVLPVPLMVDLGSRLVRGVEGEADRE